MKINNQEVIGNSFAYDGCHKIYIIEDVVDKNDALQAGYDIFEIEDLEKVYDNSCELRFINNWKLTKTYVGQFEDAEFTY